MHTLVLSAGVEPSSEVQVALKHAGGNRSELEGALREAKGKDTEYLITHASQYDLVNLTAQQIIENVTYARKAHEALPYLGEKLEYELWRGWVLPHRVLEEDLSLWRKDFYERMQPVIDGKQTTADVAEAIRHWLWGGGGPSRKVVAGEAENRLRDPVSMLQGATASCGELALLHVSFLRAVGIPARHCGGGWWHNKDGWHFYTEYWDNQLKRWVATDDVPVTPVARVQRGDWQLLGAHAVPGFSANVNAYYTEDFSSLLDVTEHLGGVVPFHFQIPGPSRGSATVAVWNTMGWRKVAVPERDESGSFFQVALSQPRSQAPPLLVTVVRDQELLWGMANPGEPDGHAELQLAKAGMCLRWPGRGSVAGAGGDSNGEP